MARISTFRLVVALALAGSAFTSLQAATALKSDSRTALQVQRALSELRPSVQVQGRSYRPENITELMRRHQVPAVSIAVLRGNRIAWSGAFGVADPVTRRAATTDTLFQAASISKPIAASAALKLVEQGQFSLDAPVNARLKSWRIPDAAGAK